MNWEKCETYLFRDLLSVPSTRSRKHCCLTVLSSLLSIKFFIAHQAWLDLVGMLLLELIWQPCHGASTSMLTTPRPALRMGGRDTLRERVH